MTHRFKEHDTFRLTDPLTDTSIPVGSIGVVLLVYDAQPPVYEVEFPDEEGRNLGRSVTYTLSEQSMEKVPRRGNPQ